MTAQKPENKKPKTPKKPIPPPPSRPWTLAKFSFDKKKKSAATKNSEAEKEREIEESLESIYLSDGDDLTKISRKKTHRVRRFILWAIGLLATTSVLAWAGLLFFQPDHAGGGDQLALAINAPISVTIGKEERFTVYWKNQSMEIVRNAEVRLSFPGEFTLTQAEPKPTSQESKSWSLGILSPGDEGQIKVQGIFLGEIGAQSAMQVIATFRPSGSDRDYDALATATFTYDQTVVESQLILPPKVVAGDDANIVYRIQNHSDRELTHLLAHIVLPEGFVPSASSTWRVLKDGSGLEWPLDSLPAETTTTVSIQGAFASGSAGNLPVQASVGTKALTNSFLAMSRAEGTLSVLAGDLGLTFVVNGSNTDRTIQPGDPLRITIGYSNISPEDLGSVEVKLGFESVVNGASATGTTLLNWSELEDSQGGVSSTRPRIQTIQYDSEVIPLLKKMAPQQEGTIEVAIPSIRAASGTQDAAIRLTVEGRVKTVGKDEVNRSIRTKPVLLHYRTDADLAVQANYFTEEGAPVGSGPLPPVAGETTAYRVTWKLEKHLHELSNINVSAVLPQTAAWSGKTLVNAGNVSYDEASRTVTWALNRMPAPVSELEVSFEVQITPAELDVGRFAQLLGETHVEANDADVSEQLTRSKPPLSTDLQNDEGARGKGVVRARE